MQTLRAVLLLLPLTIQPLFAEDLLDIYQQALQYDAQYRAAEAAYQSAREAKPQAWAPLLPQLAFEGSTQLNNTETISPGAPPPFNSRQLDLRTNGYTLSLNQAVYHHDLIVQLKQSDSTIAQASAERSVAQQQLLLRVAEAYFNVLAAQDNLEFAAAEKEAIGRQLEQANKRFEVGLIAITDVKEAQASYDLAVATEIDAMNQVAISKESLQVITDRQYDRLSGLSSGFRLVKPEPDDIDAWVDTALQNNLELIASQHATEAASLEVKQQRAGHYPTLDLLISKSETDDFAGDLEDRTTDDETISLSINVPLFSGGLVSSRTRQATHDFHRMRELETQQRRVTTSEARQSYLNVIAGISRVKALEQALVSNEAAAEATEAGFEVGTRTSVDVLLALRETFRARRDYARARYDYLLDTLRLKQASGTLNINDVIQVNRSLR